ncbi:MAG: cobalamin biosynthesis protein CbiD [Desulfamplus sp.]|nr:cobalamin biosynthesis protein CbiD [Desulfamplus sp.]
MSSKELRSGFTTGAAAAAATKAALLYLIKKEAFQNVVIRSLSGENLSIAISSTKKISENSTQSIVIKDAGDDPDVTHKAEIGATVSISSSIKVGNEQSQPPLVEINIKGGKGVGVVTKPGLEVLPRNHAINSGPKKMIKEAILDIFSQLFRQNDKELKSILKDKNCVVVDVEVFVPKGEELAKKTLNERLGILGGISILGTTGIVKPMSHSAYIATIKSGVSVALATRDLATNNRADAHKDKNAHKDKDAKLVFTTGRRSEKVAMLLFPDLPDEAFIQIGDFFQASLQASIEAAIKEDTKIDVSIVVFFGKAVKMAMGFAHTHAAKSELTMKNLSNWAKSITDSYELSQNIANANTARHAFSYIYPDYPKVIDYVGSKIVESADRFASEALKSLNSSLDYSPKIRAVILDFDGNKIFDSKIFDQTDSQSFNQNMEIV